ncbi:MAG: helix-turn-helix transcriptional regulator [Actinomycetota bacterium]|nr:helix-turn-helix transcriptional regulator [Actinomycetota bacterium]MDA8355580.1 helix-turn-helix transcriptional regulator [Actinomycetota bacterium]
MRTAASDPVASRHAELAAFLRARRADLKPEDVGLHPPPGRRNTPGLRREEVAQISGVGVTWYTWLEQGRVVATSAHVIDALARAFRLDREAHHHLRFLADLPVPEPDQMPDGASPELDRLLATLMPAPACLLGPRFDFIAWNEIFATLWDPAGLPPGRRNVMWLAFADPAHRRTWVNWGDRSRILLAEFRAAAGQHAGDVRFAELVEALNEASTEFRLWWSHYEVRQSITGPITIRHPGAGIIKLDVIELRVSAHPSLTLAVHVPVTPLDRKKLTALS